MNANSFLQAVDAARATLASPELKACWDQASALPEYTVAGLAGHLVRGATTVLDYLAAPELDGEPIDAAAYFAGIPPAPDVAAPQQLAIRQRATDAASVGPDGLVQRLDAARSELATVLTALSPDRKVKVYADHVMRLDDYLVTRMVELLVHTDDLAVSLGLMPMSPPRAAAAAVLPHLLAVARLRSGDLAVLRAFSRRERDDVEALRVF